MKTFTRIGDALLNRLARRMQADAACIFSGWAGPCVVGTSGCRVQCLANYDNCPSRWVCR
ncbi:hypothetical protein [Micromonospora costi]|uniref:Uncharacterized protein n=1 Tax=Micromonospora costi TaxID=1530042 RepID=A0A3B0A5Y8_9ACTN|nr:hypothetical protein [Micromonospora costi]RKN55266.1 hypothetical protein D7193_11220 [Micromonospora costi]